MTLRHKLGSKLRALQAPFVRLHARNLFSSVALQVFTIMVLVEAIFLAERFPMVFRDVFKHHADAVDTLLLFLCESPQVFDLALSIAILIAVYWTIVRMRENRELLVLFAAGTGPYRLLTLVLTIAVLAQIGSLVVSGVFDPMARYEQRVILFNATVRVLTTGINTGQFYHFPNRVAFAPARPFKRVKGADLTRSLFVYEQTKPDAFRVITANNARLEGPDPAGRMLLKLGGFTSHTFAITGSPRATTAAEMLCQNCSGDSGSPRAMLSASDLTQQVSIDELLSFMPRGDKRDELTIFDQFSAKPEPKSPQYRAEMRLLGERFARSLLCLLAPLVALASVCLTTRSANYLVLPLACLALMALNVISEWLVRVIVPLDPMAAIGIPTAIMAICAASLIAAIVSRQGKLALPQMARS